ncbi:vacuolar sorting protein VPS33/slp1 [Dinochytrium kinnereticum]|nr:vacuolar sorting protein VPS33/slp1 [Dinochytrium kinnereticum]
MSNLKDAIRKKIIVDMIRAIQPASKWKIVVVDSKALKILNSVCKMHDILEENVTLVEDISRKRTSYSQKEAIYFITPTIDSVKALVEDFSRPKPMYAAAHVFFTSALSDELFAIIKKSAITIQYLKTVRELFVDFLAHDHHVFSVDSSNSLFALYNPIDPATQQLELTSIAKKLVSVLSTLGERPFIRYYDPSGEGTSFSYRLGMALENELEELQKNDTDFPPKSLYKRAIMILAERPFDLMAPFLHEFTYQAMINDLLVTEGGKYVYHSEGSEDGLKQKATLDESDSIYMLIRYWHFAEAVEYIRDTFNRFLTENKAALTALGHDESLEGIQNLNQLKDTLTSLPEFQDMKSKFSVHINICQECKSLFERRRLDSLAAVEQDLATGETADGKIPKNIIINMGPLLDDPSIQAYDKLRLLILYIIAQEGIMDADRRRLLEASKLSLEDSQAITNLGLIGVKLTSNSDKKKKKEANKYSYHTRTAEKRKKKKKKGDDELPYDLSRYVPMVKYLLEEPLPEDIGSSKSTASAKSHSRAASNPLQPLPNAGNPYSLRTTRPSWATKAKSTFSSGNDSSSVKMATAEEEEYRRNGPRIILFMLGGATFSEIRACYEVMKESKRDILIGSTNLHNPTQYIRILKELHKPDGYTNLGSQTLNSSLSNLVDSGVSPKGSNTMLSPATPNDSVAKEPAVKEEKDKKGLKNIFKKKAT